MGDRLYHHGNLRNSLIENGIQIVNEEGEKNCSLRKAAARCGVSHAAPYTYFRNKEELISSMKEYVIRYFISSLKESVKDTENQERRICSLGRAYVEFFIENPNYFYFLFGSNSCYTGLTGNPALNASYRLFESTLATFSETGGLPLVERKKNMAMWAMVHGIAAMAVMGAVAFEDDWGKMAEDILKGIKLRL